MSEFKDEEIIDGDDTNSKIELESKTTVRPMKEVPFERPTLTVNTVSKPNNVPQVEEESKEEPKEELYEPYEEPVKEDPITTPYTAPVMEESNIDINGESSAETIVVDPTNVLAHIVPQKNKWWHFQFKHQEDEDAFVSALHNALANTHPNDSITVDFNYEGKHAPDVIIMDNNRVIGKIHFLHMDRPDRGNAKKYYVKLHLFSFSNRQVFRTIKDAAITFFTSLKTHTVTHAAPKKHSTSYHTPATYTLRKHLRKHTPAHKHKHPHKHLHKQKRYHVTHKRKHRTHHRPHQHPHKKYHTTHKHTHKRKHIHHKTQHTHKRK